MSIKLIKSGDRTPPATTIWYIQMPSGRPGLGALRRYVAEQGMHVETVTDRVVRVRSDRSPNLPADWGCVVAPGEVEEHTSSSGSPPATGTLVRLISGPAAGWVGRVRAVEGDRLAVEILVWGQGMVVRVPATEVAPSGGLPWERSDAGSDAGGR